MTWLESYIEQHKYTVDYQTELSIIDLNEKIVSKMEELRINRAELAKRLGVSKAFVTKLLNGSPNMTIKTMIAVALALDCQLYLDIYPKDFEVSRKPVYVYTSKNYQTYIPEADEVFDACAA